MESVVDLFLRSAKAEAYIEAFQQHNIEAGTLPLLTDSDLQVIGVDNADVRKEILEKSSKLKIPHEKKLDLEVTEDYADLVISQISRQLHLHNASLSCAVNRKDVRICDVKLHNASQCLLDCITSLEQQLDEFENKFDIRTKPKKRIQSKNVVIILGASTLALCLIGKLVRNFVLK